MRKMILAALLLSSAAGATPSGTVQLASIPGGGFTLSAGSIDFISPVGGGFGDFSTGAGTNISYNNGSGSATLISATNPYGQIKDITFGSGPITNFIQFYTSVTTTPPNPPGAGALQQYPVFDLVAITPGGSVQGALNNCAGVTAIGVSCSPLVTVGGNTFVSPLVLTNRIGFMDVSFGVSILGRDATGSATGAGGFTTQITGTNASAFQTLLNSGGTSTTYSGVLALSSSIAPVPEPASWALMLMGFGLLGAATRRRVRAVAYA